MSARISTGQSGSSTAIVLEEPPSKNKLMTSQLAEFQERLDAGASNFSKDTLHYWLKLLTEKEELSYQNTFINSVSQLRKLVEWITGRYKNSKKRDRDGKNFEMIRYFEWFFGYIQYLRELYQDFHERLYEPLFDYFYDDDDDVRDDDSSGKATPENRSRDSGLGNETSGVNTAFLQPSISKVLVQLAREFSDVSFTLDNEDLHNTASDLYELMKDWRGLIDSDRDIDAKLYSKDSLDEVTEYTNIGNFRQFLRLVPDILLKTKKALKLVQKWLNIDDKKMKEVDKQLNMVEQIQTRLELRVIEMLRKIQNHETEFNAKSDELQMLLLREDRSNELNVRLSFIQGDINILQKKLDRAYKEGGEVLGELEKLKIQKREHTDEYGRCASRYDDIQRLSVSLIKNLELEEYKYRLVEEDMFLELEVKPSMVRYTNQVEDDCERIEKSLEEEKKQKRKLEHALKPLSLKTGRDVTELLNLCMQVSVTPASIDIMASSAASLNKLFSGKSKGLESVNEGIEPELSLGGAHTPTPNKNERQNHERPTDNRRIDNIDYSRRTPEKGQGAPDKNDDDEKENQVSRAPEKISGRRLSRIPVPVKRDRNKSSRSKSSNRRDKGKRSTQGGNKKQPGDVNTDNKTQPKKPNETVTVKTKGPTKTVAKTPIVKPSSPEKNVKKSEPKKPTPLAKPPTPPGRKKPGVELPWYRRKNVFPGNNDAKANDLRSGIRSRDNLEHMYGRAAARQNADSEPDVAGHHIKLQRRKTRNGQMV